jgi:hydroxyacylglutathione hydrolase
MIFEQVPVGIMQNYSYIIADEASKEAAVVDPGWEAEKILHTAEKLKLDIKKILLTHAHFDHANRIGEIAKATHAAVYIHEKEAGEIKKLGIEDIKIIKNNDIINIGKINIKVLHTPGHTPGSVCFLVNDEKLITGDTLFVEAIGRVDLPGGDEKEMRKSLDRLKKLNDKIEIYPGHDYGPKKSSTIGYEKKNNLYMKL